MMEHGLFKQNPQQISRQRADLGTLVIDLKKGMASSKFEPSPVSEEGLFTLRFRLTGINDDDKLLRYRVSGGLQNTLEAIMRRHRGRRELFDSWYKAAQKDLANDKQSVDRSELGALIDLVTAMDLLRSLERDGRVVYGESTVESGVVRRILGSQIGQKTESILEELASKLEPTSIRWLLQSGDEMLALLAMQAVTTGNAPELARNLLNASEDSRLPLDVRRFALSRAPGPRL